MREHQPHTTIMEKNNFLLVSLPFQGHINPTLRLATKLIGAGARVTFVTTVNGLNNLKTRLSLPGLSYDSFSDGDAKENTKYLEQMKLVGSVNFKNLLLTKIKEGQKVDFLIYGLCLPWVAEVARTCHVPSAFLFFQSATSFAIMHHFFKNDGGMVNSAIDPNGLIEMPGLPLLRYSDIPTYFKPSDDANNLALFSLFQHHIQILEADSDSLILINTFEEMEEAQVESIPNDHINVLCVGPLVYGTCDVSQESERETYLQWLDTKPKKSVIFVSFGSLLKLNKKENEEIFRGLVEYGHPFLLVIRDDHDELMMGEYDGMIVRWCSQVEVLNHEAIGCFVTHCGWNSMMESVVSGVAVVGCPRLADQMINAKMVDEVWGNGVKAVADCDGVLGREEIKRCLEVVMGSVEIKNKCENLKNMAMEAMAEGGAAHSNLKQLFTSLENIS